MSTLFINYGGMLMLNQETATQFYTILIEQGVLHSSLLKERVEGLCSYVYPSSSKNGLYDHDYWDHLIAPTPWLFSELGFIPPTLVGEVFADIVSEMRRGSRSRTLFKQDMRKHILDRIKFWRQHGLVILVIDDMFMTKITEWVAELEDFWDNYPHEKPGSI